MKSVVVLNSWSCLALSHHFLIVPLLSLFLELSHTDTLNIYKQAQTCSTLAYMRLAYMDSACTQRTLTLTHLSHANFVHTSQRDLRELILSEAGHFVSQLWSLNEVLGFRYPAPLSLQHPSAAEQFETALPILTWLLNYFVKRQPLIIVLDNLQHICQTDWNLTLAMSQAIKNRTVRYVSLMMGSRPLDHLVYKPIFGPVPKQYLQIQVSLVTGLLALFVKIAIFL